MAKTLFSSTKPFPLITLPNVTAQTEKDVVTLPPPFLCHPTTHNNHSGTVVSCNVVQNKVTYKMHLKGTLLRQNFTTSFPIHNRAEIQKRRESSTVSWTFMMIYVFILPLRYVFWKQAKTEALLPFLIYKEREFYTVYITLCSQAILCFYFHFSFAFKGSLKYVKPVYGILDHLSAQLK